MIKTVLKKKNTLYERDSDGKLIPQEWELEFDELSPNKQELIGESIVGVPIPRGDIKKILSSAGAKEDKDIDAEIIKAYCIEPSYTLEELVHIKPFILRAIVDTILINSGIDVGGTRRETMNKAEDDFAKN